MPYILFYENMVLIIDNTKRKLRELLRLEYLKRGIPCALSDFEHATDHMPCCMIQVTEDYLYKDALYISSVFNKAPVVKGENIQNVELRDHPHIKFFEGGVLFCSKKIYLTKTEELILHLLLLADDRVTAETVADYCMKTPRASSVAVHICNINVKSRHVTGIELVDCRRYEGYRLHEF